MKAFERATGALAAVEDEILQALDAEERSTLWDLLSRALHGAEPTCIRALERESAELAADVS